ncbi:DUF1722 domain-containing protein [Methanofollis formosanus]|uniref:DUF1722 domain-containing protein n=1 Tax=Methanofollis formosanus TaxID=299308 RepID=A0A8G1A0C9_9EURY|nr:DUF523 and DUF1722 domain-containing protein [Methanofollis formosanus]QYZ79129.1 DUF1722 domain-containing protein [Methanofollis formosanus]
MQTFERPRVVVSRCIDFDHCRWNGDMIRSEVVQRMKEHVEFVPVCAEAEIGLGIPREPVRLVEEHDEIRLVQHETDRDVTEMMTDFAASFLDGLGEVDGFLLKSRSPSCGTRGVKIYRSMKGGTSQGTTAGLFAQAVLTRHPDLPVEDEGRLRNRRIREHFLVRLFTLAAFRAARAHGDIHSLADFHARNKLLLMAYSQKELQTLGRVAANQEKRSVEEVTATYEAHLRTALERPPRAASRINVLFHALGYFKDRLSPEEKAFFLETVEQYRRDEVALCPNLTILRSWIVRFGIDYLADQTFFSPLPPGLMAVPPDLSQDQRDYWKDERGRQRP